MVPFQVQHELRIEGRKGPDNLAWLKPISRASFNRLVKKCRKLYPLEIPIRVSYTTEIPEDNIGYSIVWFDEDGNATHARIWVYPGMPRVLTIDTLVHEWTHAVHDVEIGRNHPPGNSDEAHPTSFWELYGQHMAAWNKAPLTK